MNLNIETVVDVDDLSNVQDHWYDEDRNLYMVRKAGGRLLQYNWDNVVCVWESEE
jgi:hypothetical protein